MKNESRRPPVRWGTEFEFDDTQKLMAEVGDDFAIALDRNGWMIVMKPECHDADRVEECKWPMLAPSDACPTWATEMFVRTNERRRVGYEPYPSNLEEFLGSELSRLLRS